MGWKGHPCVICKKRKDTHPDYTFHRFPKDKEMCDRWVKALKACKLNFPVNDLQRLNRSYYVCSHHFTKKNYLSKTSLCWNACPDKNIHEDMTTDEVESGTEAPESPDTLQTEVEEMDVQMEPHGKCLFEDFPLTESRKYDSNLKTYKNCKRKHKETVDFISDCSSNTSTCKDSKRKCRGALTLQTVHNCSSTEENGMNTKGAINLSTSHPHEKDPITLMSAMKCHDYARLLSEEHEDLDLPFDNAAAGDVPVPDHDYISSEALNSITKEGSLYEFQLEKEAIYSLIEKCNIHGSSSLKNLETNLDLDFSSEPGNPEFLDEHKVKKVFLIGPKNKLGKKNSPDLALERRILKKSLLNSALEANPARETTVVTHLSEAPSLMSVSSDGLKKNKAVQYQHSSIFTKDFVDQLKRNNRKALQKYRVRFIRLQKKCEKLEENSITIKEATKPSRLLRDSATCLDRFQLGILGCMMLRSSVTAHGRRFSTLSRDSVSKVFYKYPYAYDFLGKIFALPSSRSVSSWMQGIPKGPGFQEEVFELFKLRMENFNVEDKICTLQFSCIPVENESSENQSNEMITALCVMVKGIKTEWEQLLGYFLLDAVTSMVDTLQNMITTCIVKLDQYGFPVWLIVCDQSDTTDKFYEQMGVTFETPFFYNGDSKIYCMYNPTQLLIKTRDTLKHHKIKVHNKVADWEHITEFYEKDLKMKIRLAPRIMHPHVIAKDRVYTGVKMAAETMSYTVAAGLETHANLNSISAQAVDTAFFIYNIDQLFDIFNSVSENGRKKFQRGFQGDSGSLTFLKKVKEWISKWELVDSLSRITCKNGWVQNITALTGLWDDLRTQHNIKILFTRRLNLDSLDSFFELIRVKSLTEKKAIPSLKHLMDSYRYANFASLRKLMCEDDCVEGLVKAIIKSSTTYASETQFCDKMKKEPCDKSNSPTDSSPVSSSVSCTNDQKSGNLVQSTLGNEAQPITLDIPETRSDDQRTSTNGKSGKKLIYTLGESQAVTLNVTPITSDTINNTCKSLGTCSPVHSRTFDFTKDENAMQLPPVTSVEKSPRIEISQDKALWKNIPDFVSVSIGNNSSEKIDNLRNLRMTSPLNPEKAFTSMERKQCPYVVESTWIIKNDPDDSTSQWQGMNILGSSSQDEESLPDLTIKHEPVECNSPKREEQELFLCEDIELKSEIKTDFEDVSKSVQPETTKVSPGSQDQNANSLLSMSVTQTSNSISQESCVDLSRFHRSSPVVSGLPADIPTTRPLVIHRPYMLTEEVSGEQSYALASEPSTSQDKVLTNASISKQSETSGVFPNNHSENSDYTSSLTQNSVAGTHVETTELVQRGGSLVSKVPAERVFLICNQQSPSEDENTVLSDSQISKGDKVKSQIKKSTKGIRIRKMKILNEMVRILESVSK